MMLGRQAPCLETKEQHLHISIDAAGGAHEGLSGRARLLHGKGFRDMTRMTPLSSPLLLGFDQIERLIDRAAKASGDGYPPYNIERIEAADGSAERLRITLAVAGFSHSDLEVAMEENQLIIRGKQNEESDRTYLHRGIAARQFQRAFVLADGMQVTGAELENGLLSVDLERPEPERISRKITIANR
jgi:HSP20 family molecular chaperone IbpA